MTPSRLRLMGRTMVALARQECGATLYAPMTYVWCAGALLAAVFLIEANLKAILALGTGIYADPLAQPYVLAAQVCGLYFALWASTAIAREREGGTLEVLFWAPADDLGIILGKVLGALLSAALFSGLVVSFLLVASSVTGLSRPQHVAASLVATLVFVGGMAAFGLFISALTGRVRTAVVVLVAVLTVIFALQFAAAFLGTLPPATLARPLLLMRDSLLVVTTATRILLPTEFLAHALEALALGDTADYLQSLAGALGHLGVFVALSVLALKLRGVRR